MKKLFKIYVIRKATYDKTMQALDSQAATIERQGKKLLDLSLQIEQLKRENHRLKEQNFRLMEQNSRLNYFVDIQLGIKDIDYPDVIKN